MNEKPEFATRADVIRADEREKYEQAWGTGIKAVEYRVTADLRAKVAALREEKAGPFSSPMNAYMIVDDYTAGEVSAFDAVLALIDGSR